MHRSIYSLGISLLLAVQAATGQTPPRAARAEESVRDWIESIDGFSRSGMEAAYDLRRLAPITEDTVPLLVKALESESEDVRPYIANAIGELSERPEVSVPALLEALERGPMAVRDQAVVALIRAGAPSVPGLLRMLKQHETRLYSRERAYGREETLARRGVFAADYAAAALIELGPPSVPGLVEMFKDAPAPPADFDKYHFKYNYAVYILGRIGEPAVPALRGCLKNGDRTTRALALATLLSMEARAADAVPDVVGVMNGDDPSLQTAAVKVLKEIGARAVPALTDALRHKSDDVRHEAADALDAFVAEDPTPLPALANTLINDADFSVRFNAGYALRLGAKNVGKDVLRLLTKALKSPEREVREAAAEILGAVGPRAAASVPQLEESLRDDDEGVRLAAAAALIFIGRHTGAAAAVLIKGIRRWGHGDEKPAALKIAAGRDRTVAPALAKLLSGDWEDHEKAEVMEMLGVLGPAAGEAVPALLQLTKSSSYSLRRNAAIALAKIGAAGFPRLLAMSKSNKEEDRWIACQALGEAGEFDERVVRALTAAVADPDVDTRAAAVEALGKLADLTKKTAPYVIRALGDDSEHVRRAALVALAEFGQDAAPAAPLIIADIRKGRISDLDRYRGRSDLLAVALTTLSLISSQTEETAAGLVALLDQFEPPPPLHLVEALAAAGDPVIPALVAALKQPNANIGRNAHFVIGRFGPRARAAMPVLVSLLRDREAAVRESAATSLGLIGVAARSAAPELTSALSDPEEEVRYAAARALLGVGHDVRTVGPLFNTVITDFLLVEFMDKALAAVSGEVWVKGRHEGAGVRPAASHRMPLAGSALPPFPWPPPPSSAKGVLPESFFAGVPSMKAAFAKTAQALAGGGFDEYGLFEAPGGFVLVTRVERIREDGTSFPGPDRWTNRKVPTIDPLEILRQVFIYKPGQWRLFSFVFTSAENFGAGREAATEEGLRRMHIEGGKVLPGAIGQQTFKGRRCYVLIYRLEKKLGEGVQVKYDDPMSAERHLRQAGIWGAFN